MFSILNIQRRYTVNATVIWQPRYWDKKVLVDRKDVRPEKCFVYFACDRNLPDLYSYDGSKVREECGMTTNGKIVVYEIPLDWLDNEGELPKEFISIRDKEYAKYKKKMLKR